MAGAALGVGALVQPAARYFFRGDSKRQITVNFPRHPHYNIILSLLPEFTEKTGISVRVDILNYMRMYEKQMLELSKPVGDYDVICHLISWKTEYAQKRLVTPIDMFCTNKQFEEEDIIPAYKQGISTVGDRHYGFPSGAETSLLGYRADILKKHGMTPPKTYDELIDHIDYFKKAEPDLSPMGMRTKAGHSITHGWLLHLSPYGGQVFDEHNRPLLTSNAAVSSLDFIKKIVSTGSVGMGAWSFGNVLDNFLQGKVVYYLDSMTLFGQIADKNRSRVKDLVDYAPHPKAKTISGQLGGFGLCLPKNAKNKPDGYRLIKWLLRPENDLKIALQGGAVSRTSTLNNPELLNKFKGYNVIRDFVPHINPDWRPYIPEWGSISARILGPILSRAVVQDIPSLEALEDAQQQIITFMQKAGYYS